MESFKVIMIFAIASLLLIGFSYASEPEEVEDIPEEKLEYAKNSVCGYCSYCKVIPFQIIFLNSSYYYYYYYYYYIVLLSTTSVYQNLKMAARGFQIFRDKSTLTK